jgi:hypothetical protein
MNADVKTNQDPFLICVHLRSSAANKEKAGGAEKAVDLIGDFII